jgi:hypothetical protein
MMPNLISYLQVQEIYGASGYFLEGVGANKKKHS